MQQQSNKTKSLWYLCAFLCFLCGLIFACSAILVTLKMYSISIPMGKIGMVIGIIGVILYWIIIGGAPAAANTKEKREKFKQDIWVRRSILSLKICLGIALIAILIRRP